MINFKTNKILLAFLLAIACAGMNGAWAMDGQYVVDLAVCSNTEILANRIFTEISRSDCTKIILQSDGRNVATVNFARPSDLADARASAGLFLIKFDPSDSHSISFYAEDGSFTARVQGKDYHPSDVIDLPFPANADALAASLGLDNRFARIKARAVPVPEMPIGYDSGDESEDGSESGSDDSSDSDFEEPGESWFATLKYDNKRVFEGDVSDTCKFNKREIFSAAARLAAIELSQYCKGQDGSSTKTLLTGILADITRIINDFSALQNQKYWQVNIGYDDDKFYSWLDFNTQLFMVADALNIAAKVSKLFDGQKKTSNKKVDLAEVKKDVKVGKILKMANKLNVIAPHFEGALAVARGLAKRGEVSKNGARFVQLCTLFISLTRIVQYLVETADSKSAYLQAAPYLMLATTVLATLMDTGVLEKINIKKWLFGSESTLYYQSGGTSIPVPAPLDEE